MLLVSNLALADGQAVFNRVFAACHLQGVQGAPKFGSYDDWRPRIKEGKLDLIAEGYMGVRLMPAKGGDPDLSLDEFSAAVIYMANQSGANWQKLSLTEKRQVFLKIQKNSQIKKSP